MLSTFLVSLALAAQVPVLESRPHHSPPNPPTEPLPVSPIAPAKPSPEPMPVPVAPVFPTPQATTQAAPMANFAASCGTTATWAAPVATYRVKSKVKVIRVPFFARRTYGTGSCQ